MISSRIIVFVHRILPWCSLAVGIVGALLMDRGPRRGAVVAVVGLLSWLVLILAIWLGRLRERRPGADTPGKLLAGAHFSSLLLTQSSIHLQLYFAVPFYFKAFAGTLGHVLFLCVLVVAAIASLWDPLTEFLLTRTRYGLLLPAFANFVALNAVLPGVGLSHRQSLWAAAIAASLAWPALKILEVFERPELARGTSAQASVARPEVTKRRRLIAEVLGVVRGSAMALVMPVALVLGGAALVPAAPLHLVSAEIGTRQAGRGVADPVTVLTSRPTQLVCATAVFAPQGLRDRLVHVWRHDREVVDRIALDVRGGRKEGFRTWSIKRRFGPNPAGRWSCSVETDMGQSLGAVEVLVDLDASAGSSARR